MRFHLTFCALFLCAFAGRALGAEEPRVDGTFFNGKDLTGWTAPAAYWSVQDGAIVGHIDTPVPQNEFVWSNVVVKDFYLSVDVKIEPDTHNGGIQFRSQKKPPNEALGYQADMGKGVWGRLYHESGRKMLYSRDRGEAAVKVGEWNHYEILAVGHHVWTAINGKLSVSVDDPQGESSGYIALQMHKGPPLDVRYKINKLVHNPKIELIGLNEQQLNAELVPPDDANPPAKKGVGAGKGAGPKAAGAKGPEATRGSTEDAAAEKGAGTTSPGGKKEGAKARGGKGAPAREADANTPDAQPQKRFGQAPSAAGTPKPAFPGNKFALSEADVVIFAGQTNMVRAQESPYLESLLARHFAEHKPRFRSMAWEGDTVYQQWRDMNFGGWYDQLAWSGATVVIAQFGHTESFDGIGRLGAFVESYGHMIDEFQRETKRVVLLSPTLFEKPQAPLVPDHSQQNAVVKAYRDAIQKLAAERGCLFVDLIKPLESRTGGGPLTRNGIHLNDLGQRTVARIIAEQLGIPSPPEEQLTPLRSAIAEKNDLWFENWRPMNWAFAYGDRITQPFGKPAGDRPALKIEFEDFKPIIAAADQKIQDLAIQAKAASH